MRKFDLSLRSSRSSYFATFRHQLTILSKTDALDEEKWLNMLGTFVKDWFRYESHFVHGRDSLVDILKEQIGRASCRERVEISLVAVSLREELVVEDRVHAGEHALGDEENRQHRFHLFFFKQKTAYEFGLGIPAEPLFRSRSGLICLARSSRTGLDMSHILFMVEILLLTF